MAGEPLRIAYITAGAAGMYCGSCLHDNALAAAFLRMGHDVALIPTYTPIRTDETDVSIDRVFYGAINVYLEQKLPFLRYLPRPLVRLLDRPGLLNRLSRLGSSTDPGGLGDLTLSVLQGEHGRQSRELDDLVTWLRDDFRPAVVHITNSMLLGLARRIKSEMKVAVFCSVQGEDLFLEGLEEPYRTRVHEALKERVRDVDGLIAHSDYYRDHMRRYLDVDEDRIHRVVLGLNLEDHGKRERRPDETPFTIGYLARLCPEKGLHLLAQAYRSLADRAGTDRVRLKIAGYLGERDRPYVDEVLKQLEDQGLGETVDYRGELGREEKLEFLSSIHVLSVPTTYREPKGLFVLEALANGVPVVQPRHGAFPETIESTAGGLLFEPGSVEGLAAGLGDLMDDREKREELGRRGKERVHRLHRDEVEAGQVLDLYRRRLRELG